MIGKKAPESPVQESAKQAQSVVPEDPHEDNQVAPIHGEIVEPERPMYRIS